MSEVWGWGWQARSKDCLWREWGCFPSRAWNLSVQVWGEKLLILSRIHPRDGWRAHRVYTLLLTDGETKSGRAGCRCLPREKLGYFGLQWAASASRGRSSPSRTGAGGRGSPQFPLLAMRFSAEVCIESQGVRGESGAFYSWWPKLVPLYPLGDCDQQPYLCPRAQPWHSGEQISEHYLRKSKMDEGPSDYLI